MNGAMARCGESMKGVKIEPELFPEVQPARRNGMGCPKYSQLIPKRNTKSAVWSCFLLPADEEGTIVKEGISICTLCRNAISSVGGSTTNMMSHIKVHHPAEYKDINSNRSPAPHPPIKNVPTSASNEIIEIVSSNEIEENPPRKKQKTLLEFESLPTSFEKQCTDAVTKFIATTMQPFSIVEHEPFIDMLRTLNSRYKLPGRKYFSKKTVPKLFNTTKEKIKSEFAAAEQSNVSITADYWTSVDSTVFIAVTGHFINNNWELVSACLCCVHFEDGYTAKNISDVLKSKLLEWNIDINLTSACTTDIGADISKAISSFDVQQVPCFGDTINIGINRALQLPVLQQALSKLKKLQNGFSHCSELSRNLLKSQVLLQIKATKLPSACPNRWGSTLRLCKSFLENQASLRKLMKDYPTKKQLMLEKNEISALEDFVNSITLIEEVTKVLMEEKYIIASSVLPLLKKIKKSLKATETDKTLVKYIKIEILSAIQEYYFDCSELIDTLRLATVCDPRFRLNYIEEKEEVKKIVLSHMLDTYESDATMPNISTKEEDEKCWLEKLLDSDEDDEQGLDISLPARKVEDELTNYLSMPKVNLNEDPLIWWKAHEASFPCLKILAKKFLVIQGTSGPPERVFGTRKDVISNNRTSLLPKNAEMQVFLSQNECFIYKNE